MINYALLGSDVKIRCLTNGDDNNTETSTFKWNYKINKHKSSKKNV